MIRRGQGLAFGVLAFILIALFFTSLIAVAERSRTRLSRSIILAERISAERVRENLNITDVSGTAVGTRITVKNIGSIPSTIVYAVANETGSGKLDVDSVSATLNPGDEKTIDTNLPYHSDWKYGVVTEYGCIYWYS